MSHGEKRQLPPSSSTRTAVAWKLSLLLAPPALALFAMAAAGLIVQYHPSSGSSWPLPWALAMLIWVLVSFAAILIPPALSIVLLALAHRADRCPAAPVAHAALGALLAFLAVYWLPGISDFFKLAIGF